jgi:hypothetical protein
MITNIIKFVFINSFILKQYKIGSNNDGEYP